MKILAEITSAVLDKSHFDDRPLIRGNYFPPNKTDYLHGHSVTLGTDYTSKVKSEDGSWLIWYENTVNENNPYLYKVIPRTDYQGLLLDNHLLNS